MAKLFDLSTELLFQIVANVHAWHKNKRDLQPLSLACKRLNSCCGRWIFKKYVLCLRTKRFPFKHLTPLDNNKPEIWNLDVVTARLLHFREKAPYVEELIIEDVKNANDDPELLPECIMSDLLGALEGAKRVTSVAFNLDCRAGCTLPLCLWDWMGTRNLTKLSVPSKLAPSPSARILSGVRHFKGWLYEETMPFLDVSR